MADIRKVEQFLFHEAQLLDDARFDDWLALFTETAWYWVPISPTQVDPVETVSIIYDDRRLLETRVRRLNNPNIHAQSPPSRTSRIIGNVMIDSSGPDSEGADMTVSSRFQMTEFRRDTQRHFAGKLLHGLNNDGNRFRIAWKRIDLVNSNGMMEGITVPF